MISTDTAALAAPPPLQPPPSRDIATRTGGHTHGPITRVVSPSDIGGLIKPFVFLDWFDFSPTGASRFPMHPHSGIATVSVLLSGDLGYEDSTGASGTLATGSVEWMRAGGGVWHTGHALGTQRIRGYQLWVALPQALENAPPQSQYLPAASVPRVGPARVILGEYAGARSPVLAPAGMNYLHVRLADGESWRYEPPAGHTLAWAHAHEGTLQVAGTQLRDELAVFTGGEAALDFTAEGETGFVIGSAVPHPHDLVLGRYSVHSSAEALDRGKAEIARIGHALRAQGRLR